MHVGVSKVQGIVQEICSCDTSYICVYIYLIFLFLSIKTIYIGHVSF